LRKTEALRLVIVGVIALLIVAFALPGCGGSPQVQTQTVVKLGFLAPLSGDAEGWGAPGLTGLHIWADDLNKQGGMLVGDKRIPVEIITYDDQYTPSLALQGAKKLILQDHVDMLIPSVTGDTTSAIQQFATEHKTLMIGMEAVDNGPDRPYLITGGEGYPMYHAIHLQYIHDTYPNATRLALVTQDDETGRYGAAWIQAAAQDLGFNVVHVNLFSIDTLDFAPVISAALATKPDVISLGPTWPGFRIQMVAQLYAQGYTGIVEASEWEPNDEMAKVPESYLETIKCVGHNPFADPSAPPPLKALYQEWIARYGPGAPEDVHRAAYSIDWLYTSQAMIWEEGVKLAGTLDATKVRDALLAQTTVPALLGTGVWWGKEVFGANNHLLVPESVSTFTGGKEVTMGWYNIKDWYDTHGQYVIPWMENYGVMYTQR
jgi:branched-chain amino acid transport system substrate-binding protein